MLALETGRFRHAQSRWHTVDKEGFCFGVKLLDYAHWINGGRHDDALFTDHKNLLTFFSDKARTASCTKPNRERLTRWGLRLAGLRYEIFHIPGEENRLADLGSRWGNQFAAQRATTTGLRGGPKPLMLRVLKTKHPQVDSVVRAPDLDITKTGLLTLNAVTVTRAQIRESQRKHANDRPPALQLSRGRVRLWENVEKKIWIPERDQKLKRIVYALTHQGLAGHRGHKATLSNLAAQFFWEDMDKEVDGWRKTCLQCIKLTTGDMVPRPLGSQLMAERPGEIISTDYVKLGATRTGYTYVLMIVDRFTRLCADAQHHRNRSSTRAVKMDLPAR